MNDSKISVIVPVYKVERFLPKCLDSILSQTYRDLEVILVDDGSPDNCGAICDAYAAKDDRIKVIHQQNAGVSAARNAGLDAAAGEYIGFADPDDRLETDMYEYLLSLAEKTGADVVQCGLFWEENGRVETQYTLPVDVRVSSVCEFAQSDWRNFANSVDNKLYRAHTVRGLRFREGRTRGEDLFFNVEVLLRDSRVAFGGKAKYHYIQNPNGACGTQVGQEQFAVCCEAVSRAAEKLAHIPASRAHFTAMGMEAALDMASKLVVSGRQDRKLKRALISCARKTLPAVLRQGLLSRKDRVKAVLLAYGWPLYRPLLLASKRS